MSIKRITDQDLNDSSEAPCLSKTTNKKVKTMNFEDVNAEIQDSQFTKQQYENLKSVCDFKINLIRKTDAEMVKGKFVEKMAEYLNEISSDNIKINEKETLQGAKIFFETVLVVDVSVVETSYLTVPDSPETDLVRNMEVDLVLQYNSTRVSIIHRLSTCTISSNYRKSSIAVSAHSDPRSLESFDDLLRLWGLSFSASSIGGKEVAQFLSEVLDAIGEQLSYWGKTNFLLELGKPNPGSDDYCCPWRQQYDTAQPAYSPTYPGDHAPSSPVYSPTSPVYSSTSPEYVATSAANTFL